MTDYEAMRPFATARQAQVLDAIKASGTHRAAAKFLGCHPRKVAENLERLKKSAARAGWAPEHGLSRPVAPSFEVGGYSACYGPDGEQKLLWVKANQTAEDLRLLLEGFTNELAEQVQGKAKPVKGPPVSDADLMSAYVVGDAHIGSYCWGPETGGEDYDTNIAAKDLRGAFNHLVPSSPRSKVGLLVNVGDALHANDTTSETPASKNRLDTDGRFDHVIDRAIVIFRHAIDLMLRKHEQVWIVNARGNHDPDAALWLNKIIAAYYAKEPRVKVVQNASKFIYVEWGKVLIGVHHGDRVKRQQLYEAMTRDKREAWGRAKFSYFWTGHIHHKEAEEIGGCLFESFNTLAAPDAWHAGMGYGANREMQQITLHKDFGIVARNVCGLEMARLAA